MQVVQLVPFELFETRFRYHSKELLDYEVVLLLCTELLPVKNWTGIKVSGAPIADFLDDTTTLCSFLDSTRVLSQRCFRLERIRYKVVSLLLTELSFVKNWTGIMVFVATRADRLTDTTTLWTFRDSTQVSFQRCFRLELLFVKNWTGIKVFVALRVDCLDDTSTLRTFLNSTRVSFNRLERLGCKLVLLLHT